MQAVTLENDAVRRFASGHMFPMAKLVLETAFQPIVEATTGTIFGYESLMRGHDRLGFRSAGASRPGGAGRRTQGFRADAGEPRAGEILHPA